MVVYWLAKHQFLTLLALRPLLVLVDVFGYVIECSPVMYKYSPHLPALLQIGEKYPLHKKLVFGWPVPYGTLQAEWPKAVVLRVTPGTQSCESPGADRLVFQVVGRPISRSTAPVQELFLNAPQEAPHHVSIKLSLAVM